jgi:hypothetical protein
VPGKAKGSHSKREPSDSKRKRPTTRGEVAKDAKSKRPKLNTSKVSTRDQCRRRACREKGNHINHTHQDCRFKTNDQPPPTDNGRHDGARHPNLGLAPPKRVKFSKLVPPAVGSANKQETRTCYICNKPGHIAPHYPDKEANKQNAKGKLFKNKNFMVLWQEALDDQDEEDCATQVIELWGDDNLCPTCHKAFSFNHRCDPEDKRISAHFHKVKAKLRQSPLLKLIQEAHESNDQESSSSDQATPFTIDSSFFVEDDEGQQDSNDDDYTRGSERESGDDSQHSDDERDIDPNDSERAGYDSDRSSESGSQSDSNAPF